MTEFKADEESGMLTEKQRKYLLGKFEPDSSSERVMRQRIRDRLIQSIRDFEILDIGLSKDDHGKIFEKGFGEDISAGGHYLPRSEEDRDDEFTFFQGVKYGFAFLFQGMREVGYDIDDMETLLEGSISNAETPGGRWYKPEETDFTTINASVSIELEERHSLDRLYNHFEEGNYLSDEQLGKLVRAGKLSPDDIVNIVERQQRHHEAQREYLKEKYTDNCNNNGE